MLEKHFKSAQRYYAFPPLNSQTKFPTQDFPGIYTCSVDDRLDTLFDTIRKSRVHRFVIIDELNRLLGLISLSDILEYILLEGEGEDSRLE